MNGQMVTAAELAGILRVATATIYRQANAGDIPGTRVGRVWRFDVDRVKTARGAVPTDWSQSRRSTSRKRVA
ncbi:helix-turn-helix domain-containing protein [Microbacterium terrisoli]|jgi:excisionase family DNA binding protein|uniref:helix-turn-helix domain-containing protein n=1 Tax=Microbacterium terrisoli TaxID=3242192 RepID=UPI002804E028|nr:helix-turn-helix domain-containing protein [Microbacterium protaetiae]